MNINLLAVQIRQKINEGSDILKSNTATGSYVDALLRSHEDLQRILTNSPENLMAELTRRIIQEWPQPRESRLGWLAKQIGQYLKPIQEINDMLNWKYFTNNVCIPDGGVREIDSRMPVDEFKKALLQKIFNADAVGGT